MAWNLTRTGFDPNEDGAVTALCVYNGKIYAGTKMWASTIFDPAHAKVYESSDGGLTWTVSYVLPQLPSPISGQSLVTSMCIFGGELYVLHQGEGNSIHYVQLYKYDGITWSLVKDLGTNGVYNMSWGYTLATDGINLYVGGTQVSGGSHGVVLSASNPAGSWSVDLNASGTAGVMILVMHSGDLFAACDAAGTSQVSVYRKQSGVWDAGTSLANAISVTDVAIYNGLLYLTTVNQTHPPYNYTSHHLYCWNGSNWSISATLNNDGIVDCPLLVQYDNTLQTTAPTIGNAPYRFYLYKTTNPSIFSTTELYATSLADWPRFMCGTNTRVQFGRRMLQAGGDGLGSGPTNSYNNPGVWLSSPPGEPALTLPFSFSLNAGEPALSLPFAISSRGSEPGLSTPFAVGTGGGEPGISIPFEVGLGGSEPGLELPFAVIASDFVGTPLSGSVPLSVHFVFLNNGTPVTTYAWDFGDTGTSTVQNPTHVYVAGGNYTVALIVDFGLPTQQTIIKTNYINISISICDFVGFPTSGSAPQVVNFTDLSTNSPTSWLWDFGDPSSGAYNTSTIPNPSHTYEHSGSYTITLVATGPGGPLTATKTDYIVIAVSPPVADFTAAPVTGFAPLTVYFTDLSTNDPVSWLWDFGDGNTSTDQNPVHTYASDNTYTVTLIVTNVAGSSSAQATITVLAIPELVADFIVDSMLPVPGGSIEVKFLDASLSALTWSWNFGEPSSGIRNTSTLQNPSHIYAAPGTYQISLTVTNGPYTDSICKNILVTLDVMRFQEIWGTVRFSNGLPVAPNKVVQTSRTISATEYDCGGDSADPFHTYKTIDDGGTTRYLVRSRGNVLSVPDSGFADGEPVFIYVGKRLATREDGTPLSVPFFQTLPSNPNSHIELNIVFPSAVTTISPPGGTYDDRTTITLTSNVVPSKIWYTTDGSDPTVSPTRQTFTTPLVVMEGTTVVRYYTEDPLGFDEAVRETTYVVREPYVIPSPPPADYSSPQRIMMTGSRSGDIYFRLNLSGGYDKYHGTPIDATSGTVGIQTTIIQAYLIDFRGRVGPTLTFTYKIDLINPVITSFTINHGDPITTSQLVMVQVEASSYTNTVTGLLLSEDPSFIGASVRLYQPEVTYILSAPDGVKTLYAKVSDQFDPPHYSEVKSAAIVLDTEIPTFTVSSGPPGPIGSATYTFTGTKSANSGIILKINGGSEMLVVPYGPETSWAYTVTLPEGTNTLDFQAITMVGNRSGIEVRSVTITLIPTGVTSATTITKPDGTWRIPFVYFNEALGHSFQLSVDANPGPDPVVLFPTEGSVLNVNVVTVYGTATPGSQITLEVESI